MNDRKLGTCTFTLYGSPETHQARVEIEAEITDRAVPSLDLLVSRAWLLMLENQIGKVSKRVQDVVLDALSGQALTYFQYEVVPRRVEETSQMRRLATLEVRLLYSNALFALVHPRDFDHNARADGLSGQIMVNSVSSICQMLPTQTRDSTLYALVYGLNKWETTGRPGSMANLPPTWEFRSIRKIVERGMELVQQGWR